MNEWVKNTAKDFHQLPVMLLADDVCGIVTAYHFKDQKVVQLTQNATPSMPHVLATVPEDYPVTERGELIIKRNTNEINT